jgi:hypothetical protein
LADGTDVALGQKAEADNPPGQENPNLRHLACGEKWAVLGQRVRMADSAFVQSWQTAWYSGSVGMSL